MNKLFFIFAMQPLICFRKQHASIDDNFTLDTNALASNLQDYLLLEIAIANNSDLESIWDFMVRSYHYLGCAKKSMTLAMHLPITVRKKLIRLRSCAGRLKSALKSARPI